VHCQAQGYAALVGPTKSLGFVGKVSLLNQLTILKRSVLFWMCDLYLFICFMDIFRVLVCRVLLFWVWLSVTAKVELYLVKNRL